MLWPQLAALTAFALAVLLLASMRLRREWAQAEEHMRRLRFLIWKELLELRRDPRLFGIVFMAPILQLMILGYAATTDVRNVPVVVADADRPRRAAT